MGADGSSATEQGRQASFRILVRTPAGEERTYEVGAEPVVVGRGRGCGIKLDDPQVSRQHLELAVRDGRLTARDLASTAGTQVGGERLEGSRTLASGERIRLGGTELTVAHPSAAGGSGVPAFTDAPTPVARLPVDPDVLTGDPARDRKNVALLLRTVADLHAAEDKDDLLRRIVDRAIALANGSRGALLLAGAGGARDLEAAVGRDAFERDLPDGEILVRSIPTRALEEGRAFVLTDTSAPDQRPQATASVLRGSLGAVLAVPLRTVEGCIGVLYVDSARPAAGFGPAELAFFEALAAQGAVAIERARLVDARERRQAETRRRLETENARLRERLGADDPLGESEAARRAVELARRVAPSDLTVLLAGETGSGKEVLARLIHRLSPRRDRPLVVVDCGAIPESLVESELFGHERGAFTGASEARPGRFREAEGGTVLLDEIGELPLAVQPRLLRVLQERTVAPVGGRGVVRVDGRVLAATNRDLAAMARAGTFRQDLFYRLSGVTIAVPPLRERGDDAVLLAHAFLGRFAAATGRLVTSFTREALEAIRAHAWPGNVRELEHAVHRAVVLAEPPCATRRDLGLVAAPATGATGVDGVSAAETARLPVSEEALPFPDLKAARARATERFERAYLEDALRRSGGNVSKAAELAGVTRQLLHRLLKRHGIER